MVANRNQRSRYSLSQQDVYKLKPNMAEEKKKTEKTSNIMKKKRDKKI